jgi:ABC-2 type transport system permease protein
MLRLIKAELFKLFRTRAFKVLCIIALLLGVFVVGISKLMTSEEFIKSTLNGMTPEQQEQFMQQLNTTNGEDAAIVQPGSMGFHLNSKDIFNPTAKEIFHGSFGVGTIEILLAVLIGAMVAGEYSSGTIKNILAYGKKREHYYISKLIAVSFGFAIMLTIMVGIATILSVAMFGWGQDFNFSETAHVLKIFGVAVIIGMAIISLLMLLATLVKSNGTTIGIGIVALTVLPTVLSFLYGKFDWFDKIYESTVGYNWALATSIKAANGDIVKATAVGLITLVIATMSGIMVFMKQDIK